MTISIWRYSHLTLAISSSLFIIIAAITGIILAFEPISDQLSSSSIAHLEKQSLTKTIAVLTANYDELISLKIDDNNRVEASVITKEGNSETYYISPFTGKMIDITIAKKGLYAWATTLHRSLFLKSTGRFIVGFISFLLALITLTGCILIIKRQGGIQQFFTKIVKENFEQYYHIIVGRFAIIPILIITFSGVYLSLEKFSLLPDTTIQHNYNFNTESENQKIATSAIPLFKTIYLDQVKVLELPFSDDKEDYFFLKTHTKEYIIDQYSGRAISNQAIPWVLRLSNWSLLLHTGRGFLFWPIVLMLSCFALLFFIYSGFNISLKRKKHNSLLKNTYHKDTAEFILLVGSETGSTNLFANALFNALKAAKKTVYIDSLNAYSTYKNLKNLIILTATYGDGEPPVNASKFITKIKQAPIQNPINYAVVGFGSLAYAHYCQFALDVDETMQKQENCTSIVPICTINNQSFTDFKAWGLQFSSSIGTELHLKETVLKIKKQQHFTVVHKTPINKDSTYLIRIKPTKKIKFTSGDLLAIRPKEDHVERLYSIGKIDNDILLSIKKHEFGICSNALLALKNDDQLAAKIKSNKAFQSPKKKPSICIANGTGVAPFLGMIQNNSAQMHLFFGVRTQESLTLYTPYLQHIKPDNLHIAYSQKNKEYVQDLIEKEVELITSTLKNNGTIMICGSISMMKSVLAVIEKITLEKLNSPLHKFKKKQQIKTDCY